MPNKFIIELEETYDMDSGCIADILQECINHGCKVVRADMVLEGGHVNSLLDDFDFILLQPGKC